MPLVLAGDITAEAVGSLLEARPKKWRQGIIIISGGGEVYSSFGLVDALRVDPTSTIGYGMVASAALPILAAGEHGRRRAARNTTFMAHTGSAAFDGDQKEVELEAGEIRRMDKLYWDILGEFTTTTAKEWRRLCKDGPHYFGAKEARRLGVIDAIL